MNSALGGIPDSSHGVLLTVRTVVVGLSRSKAAVRRAVASWRARRLVRSLFPQATSHRVLAATGDSAAIRVGIRRRDPLILKTARTTAASVQLTHEVHALADLLMLVEQLGEDIDFSVAQVRGRGTCPSGSWFTQTWVPGVATSQLEIRSSEVVTAAAHALGPVHRATSRRLGDHDLAALIHEPISTIKRRRPLLADELDVLAADLETALVARPRIVSRIHGDFSPTNVLWDLSGPKVASIVDWTFPTDPLLPEIDLTNFALTLIMMRQNEELGQVLQRYRANRFGPTEVAALGAALRAGPNDLDADTALALAWIHHVAVGLTKQEQLRRNHLWLRTNVDPIIKLLAAGGMHRVPVPV